VTSSRVSLLGGRKRTRTKNAVSRGPKVGPRVTATAGPKLPPNPVYNHTHIISHNLIPLPNCQACKPNSNPKIFGHMTKATTKPNPDCEHNSDSRYKDYREICKTYMDSCRLFNKS